MGTVMQTKKYIQRETPSTWTMNHENIISFNNGSGFCNFGFLLNVHVLAFIY